jgi:mannosyltransferase
MDPRRTRPKTPSVAARPFFRRQIERFAPHAILLVALALRLYRLGAATLWWDEALAIWAVRKGLLGVTLWTASDVHPPLYFWSLWGWVQLMGESEFAMRTLSALMGVLTVAAVYRLGRLIDGELVGSMAALLTALSRFHIWWSQEMRMYVLAGLAGVASLYFLLRWLRVEFSADERPTAAWTGPLLGYIGATVAALYTILLMGALVVVHNLVVLFGLLWPGPARRGRLLWRWVAAQVFLIVAVGGWMALSWGRMRTWSVTEPVSLRFVARLYATLLTTGISVHVESLVWQVVLPFAILLLGVWLLLRAIARPSLQRRTLILDAVTLGLAVVLPALFVYLATLPRSIFYTPRVEARYFLPFAPAFWVFLAWSVALLARRWPLAGWASGVALVALWIALLPGHFQDRYLRDELQTMVRAIRSQAEPGDTVVLHSGGRYPIFLYYYDRLPEENPRPPVNAVTFAEIRLNEEQVAQALDELTAEYERIWLAEVDPHLSDPEGMAVRWLDDRYPQAFRRPYGPNTLTLYVPQADPPRLAGEYVPQHPLNATMGDGALLGWEMPIRIVGPPHDGRPATAYVALLWERVPDDAVRVGLYDGQGRLLLERSAPPDDAGREQWRQQFDLSITDGTPAGHYQVVVSAQGASLPLGVLRISGTEPLPRSTPDRRYELGVGEEMVLTGYRLRDARGRTVQTASSGDVLLLDLFWRAEAKVGADYYVFTHLVGQAYNPRTEGPLWGQHDGQPAEGGYPTSQWLVGDVIVDRHRLTIDADAPSGDYALHVGMYAADGQRLPVRAADGAALGDHVVLDVSVVVGP